MLKKIDNIWNSTKSFLHDMDLIVKFDDNKIIITDPMDNFFEYD